MSSSGTWQMTARKRSGCWVSAAPISRPPLLPPRIARCSLSVKPSFSRYSAAAQVRHGEYAVMIEPGKQCLAEFRRHADVEAAIGGQHCRIVAGELQSLAHDKEHWHPRAVLGRVPHLSGFVLVGVDAGWY